MRRLTPQACLSSWSVSGQYELRRKTPIGCACQGSLQAHLEADLQVVMIFVLDNAISDSLRLHQSIEPTSGSSPVAIYVQTGMGEPNLDV